MTTPPAKLALPAALRTLEVRSVDKAYTGKREYDNERSRNHYTPLYTARHTDLWYEVALADVGRFKRCGVCKATKHVSKFGRHRKDASGFRHECKECQSVAKRAKPRGVSEATKWEVWERDDFRCRQCGVRRFLEVDHILPRARGGRTTCPTFKRCAADAMP